MCEYIHMMKLQAKIVFCVFIYVQKNPVMWGDSSRLFREKMQYGFEDTQCLVIWIDTYFISMSFLNIFIFIIIIYNEIPS